MMQTQPMKKQQNSSTNHQKDQELSRRQLTNILNLAHFQKQDITIKFKPISKKKSLLIIANAAPSFGNYPVFLYKTINHHKINKKKPVEICIPNGEKNIRFLAQVRESTLSGMSIDFPDTAYSETSPLRDAVTAKEISVYFMNKGISYRGHLISLESGFIWIKPSYKSLQILNITPINDPVKISFRSSNIELMQCTASLQNPIYSDREKLLLAIPLERNNNHQKIQKCQKFYKLTPAPDLIFTNPLLNTKEIIVIEELSFKGIKTSFHCTENKFIEGMMINNATITLGDIYQIPVSVEISNIYTKKEITHLRLTFRDLKPSSHEKILSMIHKSENPKVRLNAPIENEDLWRFFFETGFIYKKKYRLILNNIEEIKKMYNFLYSSPSSISRHISYYKKGRTIGHMSLLRMSECAWLCHHHAALKEDAIKVGLTILKHIVYDINGCQWNKSMKMRYILCYFRPENSFPNFFFNGFVKRLSNSKACSSELFSYLTIRKAKSSQTKLPQYWTLSKATTRDLTSFHNYYEKHSHGLLFDALDLFENQASSKQLETCYKKHNILKKRYIVSLKKRNITVAIIIINISDIALNMSELTNCLKFCIIKPRLLDKNILISASSQLSKLFKIEKIPLLLSSPEWANKNKIKIEKNYYFWIFNTKFSKDYADYFFEVAKM